jgi:hypothetical protein
MMNMAPGTWPRSQDRQGVRVTDSVWRVLHRLHAPQSVFIRTPTGHPVPRATWQLRLRGCSRWWAAVLRSPGGWGGLGCRQGAPTEVRAAHFGTLNATVDGRAYKPEV